jgi:recombinase
LAPAIVDRIQAERANGKTLAEIARQLNPAGTPAAHGGAQWWPSTVRAVLARRAPPTSAQPEGPDERDGRQA